ncbi:MAG: DegT/DnrJ/EryC1/StrS aminotransferase family protein [Candidatus Omnitrophota bacterium]|jgi:dTDP-4-amino-4,6-dideoxygalactose transaminase
MTIFKEIPPTAGFPLRLKDILFALAETNRKGLLEEDFRHYLKIPYARATYSGTAAFYSILESLKGLSAKKTIVIPAFICPLVALAIAKAGLKVKICDIDKDSFDYDYGCLENLYRNDPDILAVVAAHLGGIPVDLERITKTAQANNVFVIEDCAQSLGAEYKNLKIGTYGDFAFFSLCRGKGLTIYEGGIAVTKNEEYAQLLNNTINCLEDNRFFSEALKILELFGYWIFYRPALFWFVFRLPQIYWKHRKDMVRAAGDYFDADIPLHRVSAFRKSLGHVTFNRLDGEISKQRDKAACYITKLKNIPGLKIITEPAEAKATYPFITLIFDDPVRRQQALKKLERSGMGGSIIYLRAITDYEYLKNFIPNSACPNAKNLANRHLTLSTSTFLDKKSIETIINLGF